MKDRLAKLIDLKSIITLALVSVFCIGFLKGVIAADKFAEMVLLVLTFYFAKGKEGAKSE
jgi:uncharacterized protein (DUF486 family)